MRKKAAPVRGRSGLNLGSVSYHQTLQAFSCTRGAPFLQPNALANSGIFDTTLLTRYLGRECGLLSSAIRMISGRYSLHYTVLYARKNFCRCVNPSCPLSFTDLPSLLSSFSRA